MHNTQPIQANKYKARPMIEVLMDHYKNKKCKSKQEWCTLYK